MESQVLYLQILDLRVYYLLCLCLFYVYCHSQTTHNSLLEKSKLFSNIKKKKNLYNSQ